MLYTASTAKTLESGLKSTTFISTRYVRNHTMYSRTVNPSVFLTFSIIVNYTMQAHVHADRYSKFLTLLSETGGAIQNLHPLLLQSRRNYSTAALLRKSSRRSYNCSTLTSRWWTEYLKCIYSFYTTTTHVQVFPSEPIASSRSSSTTQNSSSFLQRQQRIATTPIANVRWTDKYM